MSRMTIVRYGKPTRFDEAPHGSKCMVRYHNEDAYDIYLQVNKDREKPNWEHIGQFNHQSSHEYIEQIILSRLGS